MSRPDPQKRPERSSSGTAPGAVEREPGRQPGAPNPPRRSRKGEVEAARVLAAATTALARDGMAAATLGRIAAEADVDKAMVVYYFGSREALLAKVVKDLGEKAAAQVGASLAQVSSLLGPGRVTDVGVEALWTASTTVPELPRAYMALLTGSRDEEVRQALKELKATFLGIFRQHVNAIEAQGYRLLDDQTGYVTTAFAMLRGLILEWAEDGDSPALRVGIDEFKYWAGSRFVPVEEAPRKRAAASPAPRKRTAKAPAPPVTRPGRVAR